MRQPLTAIGLLSKAGEGWQFLEPVCLPLLQYDSRGRLRPDMQRWKRVFAAQPVFRFFVGDRESIRRAEDDPIDPNKKKWALRTTSKPADHINIRQLAWRDLYPLGPPALRHLNAKTSSHSTTVVAQREDRTAPAQDCLVRVLGCFDPARQIPHNKTHELFLPYRHGRFGRLPVSPVVVERFEQLADQMTEGLDKSLPARPYEPKDTRPNRGKGDKLRLQEGDLVFFAVDDLGTSVTEIAFVINPLGAGAEIARRASRKRVGVFRGR